METGFSDGHSLFHQTDPRVKLIGALVFSVSVALAKFWPVVVFALFMAGFMVALAHLNMKAVFRRLLLVNGFIVFLWLVLPFTTPGPALFSFLGIQISETGIQLAGLITLKSNAIVLCMLALPGTSTLVNLTHALHHLYLPNKLVYLFSFMIRYVDLLEDEFTRLRIAMKIRGFIPTTSLHTYRTYGYLIGMVLVRSVERAERVVQAMRCRGFDGTFYTLNHFDATIKDGVVFLSIALISAFCWMG